MKKYFERIAERKKRKKIRETILEQMKLSLEAIYNRCKNLADQHNLRAVPLEFYRQAVNLSRPNPKRIDGNAFLNEYNAMLSKLYNTSKELCESRKTDEVSLLDIKTGIELIFDNYKSVIEKIN